MIDMQIAFISAIVGFTVGAIIATVVITLIALVGIKDLIGSDYDPGGDGRPAFLPAPAPKPRAPRWEVELEEILKRVG